jgi:hypothetical protein
VKCAICGIRKPKRHCPGVHGDICTICCATEREETVDCPLDCEYLRTAHEHENPPEFDPATLPKHGIEITDELLDQNQFLVLLLGSALFEGALKTGNPADSDALEAIESLIRTYKTLDSGLYYESVPANPYAAEMYDAVQARVADLRKRDAEARGGTSTLRDAQVLAGLVILERLEHGNNNGRKRSKAFLDFLSRFGSMPLPDLEESPEPDEPRLIL